MGWEYILTLPTGHILVYMFTYFYSVFITSSEILDFKIHKIHLPSLTLLSYIHQFPHTSFMSFTFKPFETNL